MTNLTLSITGMNCGHCVKAVQQALCGLSGVGSHEVVVGSAKVSFDETRVSPEAICKAIEEEGFRVAP